MKVTLLAHTPEPEKVIAAAAKLCYSSKKAYELYEDLTEDKAKEFVEHLIKMGHQSPLEHAVFTFGIDDISRACSHQLVRHRLASFSQQSQRYVSECGFDYIVPYEISDIPEAKEQYIIAMTDAQHSYNVIAEMLIEKHKQELMDAGKSEKEAAYMAEKMGIEDARYVLPNGCETKIVVTMNARELLHFFEVRCCNRAQWEIRAVADEMMRQCKEVAPVLFKNAGALCMQGRGCPEGAMSCGEPRKYR